jgi:hypothetical protein
MPIHIPVKYPIHRVPDQSDSKLVGSWLNKKTDGAKDYSVNENDGASTEVIFEGSEGIGGFFNGTNARITVPDHASLRPATGITIIAWVKLPNSPAVASGIVGKETTFSSKKGYNFFILSDDNIYFDLGDGTNNFRLVNAFPTDNYGTWVRIAVTWDGTTMKGYLNGTQLATTLAFSGSLQYTASKDVLIGDSTVINYELEGDIEDLRIYSEAKDADWMADDYSLGIPDDSLRLYIPNGDRDYSRFRHTLTRSGGIIVGKEIELNGTDSVIDTGSDFTEVFDGSFAISFFVKPTDGQPAATQWLCGSVDAGVNNYIQIGINIDGKIQCNYSANGNSAALRSNSAIFSNGQQWWHQIAVVLNSTIEGVGGMLLYVDGNIVTLNGSFNGDTSGVDFSEFTTVQNFFIGARNLSGSADGFFEGDIKEFALYSEIKSADRIKSENLRMRKFV